MVWVACPAMSTRAWVLYPRPGQLAHSSPSCLSSLLGWLINGYRGKLEEGKLVTLIFTPVLCPGVMGLHLLKAQRVNQGDMSTAASLSYSLCTDPYFYFRWGISASVLQEHQFIEGMEMKGKEVINSTSRHHSLLVYFRLLLQVPVLLLALSLQAHGLHFFRLPTAISFPGSRKMSDNQYHYSPTHVSSPFPTGLAFFHLTKIFSLLTHKYTIFLHATIGCYIDFMMFH